MKWDVSEKKKKKVKLTNSGYGKLALGAHAKIRDKFR